MPGSSNSALKLATIVAPLILWGAARQSEGATYVWSGEAADRRWGSPANWDSTTGVPSAAGDIATVSSYNSSSVPLLLADADGNDASFTIAQLNHTVLSGHLYVANVSGGTGKLTFAAGNGVNPLITSGKNGNRTNQIDVGIVLQNNLDIRARAAGVLQFNGEITSASGATTGISIVRHNNNQVIVPVRINKAATYSGNTVVQGSNNANTSAGAASTAGGGKLMLGIANALPVTTVLSIEGASTTHYAQGGSLLMNGFSQEVAGLAEGASTFAVGTVTNAGTAATLTTNVTSLASYDFGGNIGPAGDAISLTKKGDGVQALSGANGYAGATNILAGTLALGASGSIENSSSISIAAGAVFDTSASSFAMLSSQAVTFSVDPSGAGSAGLIDASELDITNGAVSFAVTGTLDDAAYVLANYTSLTGSTFLSVSSLPENYKIDYAYNGGTQIALVPVPEPTSLALLGGLGVGLLRRRR